MEVKGKVLYYFRNLVYCVYREIRVFRPDNHTLLYNKVNLDNDYYNKKNGLILVEQLYHQSESESKVLLILEPYEKKTGLKLEDVIRVFKEGNWGKNGYCSYGGPKWAKIAEVTLRLMNIIQKDDWEEATKILSEIDTLQHNNGMVIDKFHHLYDFENTK